MSLPSFAEAAACADKQTAGAGAGFSTACPGDASGVHASCPPIPFFILSSAAGRPEARCLCHIARHPSRHPRSVRRRMPQKRLPMDSRDRPRGGRRSGPCSASNETPRPPGSRLHPFSQTRPVCLGAAVHKAYGRCRPCLGAR
jgi:hypothetical protein